MRTRFLLLILTIALCLAGCFPDPQSREGESVRLTVSCGSALTKGEEREGLTPYNENRIETVDFFFYPGEDPDRDQNAVYHVHVVESPVMQVTAQHTLKITSGYVDLIFPPGTNKTKVFAVVNYPGYLVTDEANLSGTDLNTLEAKLVTTDFPAQETNFLQPRFLMSGSTVIQLIDRTADVVASGQIDVKRLAAKVTVSINPATTITLDSNNTPDNPDDDQIWHPVLSSMTVYLVDGVNVAKLGDDAEKTSRSDNDYFSYVDRNRNLDKSRHYFRDENTPYMGATEVVRDGVTYTYYNTYPMYTYPMHWDYNTLTAPKRTPSLKLTITWKRDDANGHSFVERQYYYKIFIPDDEEQSEASEKRSFKRNNWYHYDVDVGILGAETDEGAVQVTPSCYIVDWQNVKLERKQAVIGGARFLSVENDNLEIHNISTEVSIPFVTSHPTVIKQGSILATRPYYGDEKAGKKTLGGIVRQAADGSKYLEFNSTTDYRPEDWLHINDAGTAVLFEHALENRYWETNFDYSPYTITFSLVHEDRPNDANYTRTVTITQFPAIYITALPNSDNTVQKIGDNRYTSQYWGYVYIDNQQMVRNGGRPGDLSDDEYNALTNQTTPTQSYAHWHLIWYTGGSRDIFKINATALPDQSDFIIGDPRSRTVNNLDFDFQPAGHVDGQENWPLSWYYPTERSMRTFDMISPSYRISSKHSGVEYTGLSLREAELRCAAYQEDGFPAGRWRLPTRGEIRFIAMLSANHAFTFLFSPGSNYWSANGPVKVVSNNQGSTVEDVDVTIALSRCVYDSWYWGDEQQDDRATFVWGDRQILR